MVGRLDGQTDFKIDYHSELFRYIHYDNVCIVGWLDGWIFGWLDG